MIATALNTTVLLCYSQMQEANVIERETTSIKVRPALWRTAKIEAIKNGKTVSELVEEAIEAWMKEHKKK